MLFTSTEFIVLLIITFILFYSVRGKWAQSIILIVSSLVFYGWNYPDLVTLLVISILINIIVSYWVNKLSGNRRKLIATLGVIANLIILIYFKYSPLIGRALFPEGSSVGNYLIAIPLPLGISFFTFQGISLVVDTYKEKEFKTQYVSSSFKEHVLTIFLFKSFFPQLIAGPIVKAHEFIPQISRKKFKDINIDYSTKKLILGYFLKMVVADNLKDQTYWMTYPYFEAFSGMDLLGLLFGYSMQIFADFAGYSLIAIGLASLFGYRFNENFMFPYIAASFSEFWQRWHISLSTFLKEYLYIPLGGNRYGAGLTYRNLMITMVLGGLWHGAAWSYAVWGAYHGLALVMERYVRQYIKQSNNLLASICRGSFVFSVVTLGWLFFKLPVFSEAILYIKHILVAPFYSKDKERLILVAIYSLPIVLYHLYFLSRKSLPLDLRQKMQMTMYAFLLFFIIFNSGSSGSFIYFQF